MATDKTVTTWADFASFTDDVNAKIHNAFFVGIDLAREGGDYSAITVLERVKEGQMKIRDFYQAKRTKKFQKRLMFEVQKTMLPPAKNRSNRVAKKLIKRMFPKVEFTYG